MNWCGTNRAVCVGAVYLEVFDCCVTGATAPTLGFHDLERHKYFIFTSSVVYFRPFHMKMDTKRVSETYLCLYVYIHICICICIGICVCVCVCIYIYIYIYIYLRHTQYKKKFSDNDSWDYFRKTNYWTIVCVTLLTSQSRGWDSCSIF
jgi:hypothetical protein